MKYVKSHFLLLFWKNITLLRRSPVTQLFEILIPVIVILLYFGISQSFSTTHHCFSTFQEKSNDIPLPQTVKIAVAPSTQLTRDIMNAVLQQNITLLTSSNLEYLEDTDYVNTILATSPERYTAGVVFDNLSLGDDVLPSNVRYTIRYPIVSSVGTVDWNSKSPGPMGWKCESGIGFCLGSKTAIPNTFLQQGQFQFQQAIDRAIIYIKTSEPLADIAETHVRQLPFPDWVENWFLVGLSESLPMIILIGFFWNVFITTRDIVKDRDNGIREIFKSIGVGNVSILGSSYCIRFLVAIFVSTCVMFAMWVLQIIRFSNMFLVWLVVLLFSLSVVNMCFLLGTFITSTTLGMFTILISYIITFTPFLVIAQDSDQYSDTTKYLCSILSPTAASLALHNIGLWEAEGIGLTFETLDDCVGPSGFSALRAMAMVLLDSFIYGILFVYLDGIFPGKHGIGLHWTYIFDKCFWKSSSTHDDEMYMNPTIDSHLDRKRGVELKGLEKYYFIRGRVVQAVNGITTHFRENEISTLLGYNGSGKTTTLKMLAAMHSPTKGEILINGLDLAKKHGVIRKTLGYCPQHNILIEDLTVTEHLKLFTSLKGLQNKSWEREIELSLRKLKFEAQRDTMVQHLSGGMKRKLSLGLALCGHPSVVILDEPTCGMDTEARKVTWDLLLDHRQGRTIIVSTHDMEEADLLSDRCFVLSDGQIIASGTASNIKSHNGFGYQLRLSVDSHEIPILPILQQFTPDARLMRKNYKEQVYGIPDTDKASLIALLNYIENEGPGMGITGHGLMQSDLEEALVNVVKRQTSRVIGEDDYAEMGCLSKLRYYVCGVSDDAETVLTNTTRRSTASNRKYPPTGFYRSSDHYSGFTLGVHRLRTLIKKRMLETCRNKVGILLKLIIPALLVMFSIVFLKTNRSATQLQYTLDIGGLNSHPDVLITADLANTGFFNDKNIKFLSTDNVVYVDWSEEVKNSTANDYNTTDCCDYRFLQLQDACDSTAWNSTVWEDCKSDPGTEFGYKYCFEDCFQRDVLLNYQGCAPGRRPGDGLTQNIDYFQNFFLGQSTQYIFKKYHHHVLTSSLEDNILKLTAWYSSLRTHAIAQSLNVMNNMLLGFYSNNTAGQITTSYWPFQTLSDNLTQAAEVSLPLIIFAIFTTFAATFVAASFSLFLVEERVTKMKHLQLMTGISGRVYWYANLLWDFLTYIIFTLAVLFLLAVFGISEFSGEYAAAIFLLLIVFGFAAIPITYLLTKLIDSCVLCFAIICTSGFSLCLCGILISLYIENDELHSVMALIPYAALGIGICDLYINKNLQSYSDICSGDNCATGFTASPFSMSSPGIGLQLLFLVIEGCIFSVLLISLEEISAFIQLYYFRNDVRRLMKEEPDVSKERRSIREVEADSFPVVINSISKTLQNNLVVNNVSFGIRKNQCVGLLGHNGAGKSTLFSILSGELVPTWGSVNLFGTSMISDMRGYRERIGYCPQEPATFNNLTGREVLSLFCGLRGLRKERTEEIISKLLTWTGFTRYADRITGTYSGGTLRKLSLAIALIGDPPVLLLDEPSASVDPTSRRLMWKLLRQLADSGKSILLSTHIKGEVEAVCDKIVVLNNGNAIAIGSCNQVRDKFGSGFCLQVSTTDPTEVDLTKAALEQRLKNVKFVHRVGRHLQYFVPKSSFTYSDVFIAVELLKHLVKLDHYSVCQLAFTQLDFLNRLTDDNMDNLESFLRRIHGFVRQSFRKSLKKAKKKPPPVKGYMI